MVHELHKRGYQLLRIAPGMSASGCHWRCAITPRSNIFKTHGAMLKDVDRCAAHYTSGQDNQYFGWSDATTDTVQQLADRFMERYPEIVDAAIGDDWSYAGWYVRMLGYAERGLFPIAYADWFDGSRDTRYLPLLNGESDLPMPPPGDAEDGGRE